METLATVVGASDHLHLLRRVLETIVLANRDKPIRQEHILQALAGETRWLLAGLRYRGRELSEQALKDWLEQFPAALQPVAFQVFSAIASSHYIGQDAFHDALGFLIRTSGIPPRASVSFCKWQELGASGPRVAHAMKNQANWRLLPEVDLTAANTDWPTFDGRAPRGS